MRKKIIMTWIILLLVGISCDSFGRDRDLNLIIKESKYTDAGVKVSYAVQSQKDFTSPNVRIAFKILVDDKPVRCSEVTLDVPANSTGDQIMEITIPAPCKDKSCKLAAQLFDSSAKKYRIDNWMAECPR